MEITKTIQSKNDIIESLHHSFEEISNFVKNTPEDVFFQKENKKWSIAENFEHLILSNKPIPSVLKKNKLVFLVFGVSFSGSEEFETLKANYLLKLNQVGPPRNNAYSPKLTTEHTKDLLLNNWKKIGPKYAPRLKKYSEGDLDRFRLPHPLLGKLTFREMLFFTIFHNEHHLRTMRRLRDSL